MESNIILTALVVNSLICGGVSYFIAADKNRDPMLFALVGFCIGLFGIILIACLSRRDYEERGGWNPGYQARWEDNPDYREAMRQRNESDGVSQLDRLQRSGFKMKEI